MNAVNKNNTKKNEQIQFLRGLFCVSLVLYHYTCRFSQIYADQRYYSSFFGILGNASLGAFLFISGYFFNNPIKKETSVLFLVAKIRRLYPDYLIAIFIIYLVSLFGYLGEERQLSFVEFIANIPMLNVFLGIRYVDGAHWYVTFLVAMACFFAVLIFFKFDTKSYIWVSSAAVCMLFILLADYKFPVLLKKVGDYLRYYILFSLGVSYRLYNIQKPERKNDILVVSFILNFICLYLLKDFSYLICIVVTVFVIVLAIHQVLVIGEICKPVIIVGDMSYIVYLLHQNIGYSLINYLKLNINTPPAFNIIISLLFVLLMSWGITFLRKKVRYV